MLRYATKASRLKVLAYLDSLLRDYAFLPRDARFGLNNRGRVRRIEKELGHQIISSQICDTCREDVMSRGRWLP
jgi:hypothetical protein